MRIAIRHLTTYRYEPPAERPAFRLKLYPTVHAGQLARSWSVRVNGQLTPPLLRNGFGDEESIWTCQKTCEQIEVVAEGVVETQDTSGVVRELASSARPGVFLRATPLTHADEAIQELANSVRRNTPLDSMHALMNAVRDRIEYTPAATAADTTAAEALQKGAGVCQDHAQVFAAAARVIGVPARYAMGYLLGGAGGSLATHAWAEAYVADLGWVGFDPANRQCPTDAYVRLACGFDAADSAPMRGCIGAGVCENLSASVQIAQETGQMQQ